jgi:hypothetical protein
MSRSISTRTHGMIDLGDIHAPFGSPAWCKAVHIEASTEKRNSGAAIHSLQVRLKMLKRDERFQSLRDAEGRPFSMWGDYVQYPEPHGLGMRLDVVEAVLAEVDTQRLLGDVISAAERMREVSKLTDHGTNQHTREGHDNIMSSRQGTSAAYLAGRLKRDRPDIAAQVEQGKFRSIRAAALEAGIIKEPTPLQLLRRAWAKASPAERRQFREETRGDDVAAVMREAVEAD